jgi:D-arginine dehydrogenase
LQEADFLVIGAGVAGASVAYRLAAHGSVIMAEMESQPGYHTSGRSAALYSKRYKNPAIRGFAAASGAFLEEPPAGFAEAPLLTPRGLLIIGREDQADAVAEQFTPEQICDGVAESLTVDDAINLVPALKRDYLGAAMLVPAASDIDVNGLHRGFLAAGSRAGVTLVTDAPIAKLSHAGGKWTAETPKGQIAARVVINAAGAWADEVAAAAGLDGLGIQPLRRTCITFDPPAAMDPTAWPMAIDAEEEFYFKPEAGRILASPCDEHQSPPTDAQPEEIDIAFGVDRVERATSLKVSRITHSWAGLRCFMPDKLPVVGADPRAEGFIWLAGLGGFGMMTSEALGRAATAAAVQASMPSDITNAGVEADAVGPNRLLA